MYLDRGLSPTQDIANATAETILFPATGTSLYPPNLSSETQRLFTVPTRLTIKAGTKLHLERNATLWLLNNSTLEVENGAEVQLEPGARIAIGVGASAANKVIAGAERTFGDLTTPPDGCVDRRDLDILLNAIRVKNKNAFYDLNEDFQVDVADARRLVLSFTHPQGGACR